MATMPMLFHSTHFEASEFDSTTFERFIFKDLINKIPHLIS
jgi:hypothetical protein